jgi:hypothetical protein
LGNTVLVVDGLILRLQNAVINFLEDGAIRVDCFSSLEFPYVVLSLWSIGGGFNLNGVLSL